MVKRETAFTGEEAPCLTNLCSDLESEGRPGNVRVFHVLEVGVGMGLYWAPPDRQNHRTL